MPLVLETMYKKIQKAIEEQGKTGLINKMTKISNTLLKAKIDIRKIVFKQILDNFGGHLRVVLYGAAPMNKATIIGYNNLGISLVQGYGLTETSPVVTAETDKEKRPGSIGLALANLNLKKKNPDNEGVGEITVKGPSVMLGYYKIRRNKKSTKRRMVQYRRLWIQRQRRICIYNRKKKDIIVLKNGKKCISTRNRIFNKQNTICSRITSIFKRQRHNRHNVMCQNSI